MKIFTALICAIFLLAAKVEATKFGSVDKQAAAVKIFFKVLN